MVSYLLSPTLPLGHTVQTAKRRVLRFGEEVESRGILGNVESGDLETADRADYRGPPNSGIRVDGYGGDPLDGSGTLSLIIMDFRQSDELGRLVLTEMNTIFHRLYKFLEKARDDRWRNALEETSPAFGLADMISQRWEDIIPDSHDPAQQPCPQ